MSSLLLLKSILLANALQKHKNTKKKVKTKSGKMSLKKQICSNTGMCRICDQEKGVIPLYNNIAQPNIVEDIQHFSGVMVNESDNLSKYMCQNCLNLLEGCIMFREMCQKTNKKLIEMAIKKETIVEAEDDYENVNDIGRHGDSDSSYNPPSPDHEKNADIVCTYCGQEYFDLNTYNSHLRTCIRSKYPEKSKMKKEDVPKKKFLCDVCGKTAKSNASLLVHMGIHENVFPYKCERCPYQGRTMDLLKVHQRTHLTDKPFKCTQCLTATTTASNLAKHMRHVHSTTRPHKCTYCDKSFSYQHDMKRHIKDIHLRQGTVECNICFKKYNTRKILRGHQWKVHKIKGERQGRLPSYLQCQMQTQNENQINGSQEKCFDLT